MNELLKGLNVTMSKKSIKFYILFVVVLSCLLFSACSFKQNSSNTTMNINPDGSGERIINLKINNINSLYHKQNFNALGIEEKIAKLCPRTLSFSCDENLNSITYTFSLKFSDINEYKNKINELVNSDAETNFKLANSAFAKGIKLVENYSSEDILAFLYSDSDLSNFLFNQKNLWENSDYKLSYNGNIYHTDNIFNINKIDYIPIDRIDIITYLYDNNSSKRTVNFYISQQSLSKLKQEVEEYFLRLCPEASILNSSDTETGKLFSIDFASYDTLQLQNNMNKVLDSTDCIATIKDEQLNIFESAASLHEVLDFSSFSSGFDGRTFVNYELMSYENDKITRAKMYKDTSYENLNEYINDGKFKLSQNVDKLSLTLSKGKEPCVTCVDINTYISSNNRIQRNIILQFVDEKSSEIATDYYKNISLENSYIYKKDCKCIIEITASAEQLNDVQNKIFGKNNFIDINNQNNSLLSDKTTFKDNIDLSDFILSIGFNSTINYNLSSYANLSEFSQKNNKSEQTSYSSNNIQKLNCIIPSSGVCSMEFSVINKDTGSIMLAVIVCVIFAVILLLMILFYLRTKSAKNQTLHIKHKNSETLTGYICPNCAAPVFANMNYCVNCGIAIKKLLVDEN